MRNRLVVLGLVVMVLAWAIARGLSALARHPLSWEGVAVVSLVALGAFGIFGLPGPRRAPRGDRP